MKKQANIVVANTHLASFCAILEKIKQATKQNPMQNIILVVPDKFSLNAEQMIFDVLQTNSLFNVWITTLTRLEKKVLQNAEQGLNVLTKQSGTMLVAKIILQNADKLKTYKKVANQFSFAQNMFNTINLLKSSNITPAELVQNIDNTNFGGKIKDIHTIYQAYEQALGSDKLDTVTRFELFDKVAKTDDYIQNSDIYFAMFESFTNAQMSLLAGLCKSAKSLTVGACYNNFQANKHCYDNVVFQRLNNHFDASGISTNVQFCNAKLSGEQNHILNNLLSFDNVKPIETNNVKIVECENIEQEIRYIASKIKYFVMEKGYRFEDINVAINGLDDYATTLCKIFDEYSFSYFVDTNKTLDQHYFAKTLLQIFDFVCGKNTLIDAVSIAHSPLFQICANDLATFENFCQKHNIMGNEFFASFCIEKSPENQIAEQVREKVFQKIAKFKQSLQNLTTFGQYVDAILDFVNSINAQQTIDTYSQNQDIIDKNADQQVYAKFVDLLTQSTQILSQDQMSLEFAFDIIKSGLASVNLKSAPIKSNSIFVGDASASTFLPQKALFVAGATQTRMPSCSVDAGTITDAEINNFKSKSNISPTIKEINKREKFKIFNLLLCFKQNLELTFSMLINGEVQLESEFVGGIKKLFLTNGAPLCNLSYNSVPLLIFEDSDHMLPSYFVGTTHNAVKIAKSDRQEYSTIKFMLQNNLKQHLKEQEMLYFEDDSRFNISCTKQTMFPNGNTKVSQVEKYFNCPFLQFVDYGIRPQQHKTYELKALDVGNILHKIAQLFVNECIDKNFDNIDAQKLAKQCFDKVINYVEYKHLKNKQFELENLRQEATRFCSAIKYQIDNTDYKPQQTEFKFQDYVLPNGITIKGFVDRLDICKSTNAFRVVDYKTGKEKFSFANAYFGLKTQLIVYLKILQDILKKQPVSAVYMPVKNTFDTKLKTPFEDYKLDGIILDDQGVIARMDKQLLQSNRSDIINFTLKKDGEPYAYCQSNLLSLDQLQDIMDYCQKILCAAVDEMLQGYIMPKPYAHGKKNPCEFCEYKSVCHYEIEREGFRNIKIAKDKTSFAKAEK